MLAFIESVVDDYTGMENNSDWAAAGRSIRYASLRQRPGGGEFDKRIRDGKKNDMRSPPSHCGPLRVPDAPAISATHSSTGDASRIGLNSRTRS
jgi:hypothetical protein